jgi:F0F1-type ATP synthase assembly protein I
MPIQKEDFYKGARIVGFVSFIPFILAAGPLTGYFTGIFLQKKFNLSSWVVWLALVFGFLIAVTEVIKILKAVARENKK